MVSVCMGTYNGERYIEEQLQYILNQTRQPDEVIICDDCSKDDTVKIVKAFLEKHELQEKWKLVCNEENKGYPRNFYYAMSLCHGDIVFLSDQDDVWSNEKIEYMCNRMEQNEKIKVLSCTMGLVDVNGKEITSLLAPTKDNDGQLFPISMDRVLYKDSWAGMVMAYCQDFYARIKEQVEYTGIPHDRALWTLASQEQGFYQVNRVLSFHRRHDNNTGGENHQIGKEMRYDYKLQRMKMSEGWIREFLVNDITLLPENREKIQKKCDIIAERIDNLEKRKFFKILKHYWKYRKETRMASFLCDMGIVVLGR